MTSAVITAPSGVAYPIWTTGVGTPILLLHGFTGSHETWQHIADRLSGAHEVTTLDLPGHGKSGARLAPTITFSALSDDLAWIIASHLGGAASLVGYSMGGRLALALAATHPDRVNNLILESASPGIVDDQERRARLASDERLAERILTDGIEAFVAEWERLPMWDSQANLPESVRHRQRQIRLGQHPAGLAISLRTTGTGAQPSYWDHLRDVSAPTLLIAGELDAKFAQIAACMHGLLPGARLEIVPNAGHAVHLEQPTLYVERISQFLEQPWLSD